MDHSVYRVLSVGRGISVLFTVSEMGKPVLCTGGLLLLCGEWNLEDHFIFYRERKSLL